jgi:hypothetical protein
MIRFGLVDIESYQRYQIIRRIKNVAAGHNCFLPPDGEPFDIPVAFSEDHGCQVFDIQDVSSLLSCGVSRSQVLASLY